MARGSRRPLDRQPTVRLAGIERRTRAALLLGTALQAGSLLLLAAPGLAQPAPNARPTGGAVTAGSAAITTSPSTTTITQSSQRAAINWQTFDVGSQQTVDFVQPSVSAVALNRVISPNPSQIAGRIDANGQIILINQSGVIFYHGAQVNTAGLIVSAAGMSDVNFMAGKLVFDQAANPNATIVNQGRLTIRDAGLAALVAPQVVNSGVITATLGHVVLAGAKTATLDLYGDGMLSLDVNNEVTQAPVGPGGKPVTALVTNTGVIRADGGTVQLTARQADGLVTDLVAAGGKIVANSATTSSGGSQTGTVVLGGLGGSIVLSGVVTADGSAPGSTGGQVQADASQGVTLTPAARISASGPAGGGTVAVGTTLARAAGGPGTASRLTAQTVQVAPGASIAANATANGNGGRVTVLSLQSTSMDGAIYAQGGPQGGNGGFVETSGAVVSLTGLVNTTAPLGVAGTLLLDPTDLWISDVAPPDATGYSWVSPATLEAERSSITLSADGNVFLASTNPATDPGTNTLDLSGTYYYDFFSLTLTAGANLTIDRGFTVIASSNISLTATGGAITLDGSSGVTGGLITAGQLAALGPTSLQLTNQSTVTMNASTGIALADSTLGSVSALIGTLDLSTASGGVSQAATGAIAADTLTSSSGLGGNVSLIGTNNDIASVAGPISGSGDITLVDNPIPSEDGTATLTLTGAITGKDLFFEVATAGGTLSVGGLIDDVPFPATLTAAAGGRISLVADNITELTRSTVTAAGGTVELAPYSAINTSLFGTIGVSSGLVIDAQLVSEINTGATGTLVAGGFTDVPNSASAPAPRADSISVDATADITSATAGTLDLLTTGQVSESAVLTVGTLIGKAGTVALGSEPNDITTLGSFAATAGAFTLADGGNAGMLTITGPVTSTMDVTLTTSATGSITATGSIGAGSAATLSITSGSGGITLNSGAVLTGQTINLDSGSGGISLTGNAVVGQADAVVDLTAGAAGVTEFDSSTIVAATLQGNVAGPVLLGNDNTVLTVGSFTVTGPSNAFELRDTGNLAVTGPLTATGDVSLNAIGTGSGNAITVNGSIGAGGTLSAGSGLGALALDTGAVLTAPTISLQADGITLTGDASVGGPDSVVELGSFAGFITEASTSTITAATLQTTSLGIAGSVSLLGTNNAIGSLGTFTVYGSSTDSLTLIDSTPLTVTGPVSATNPPFNSQNVVLEASGSITVSGPITASGDIILATGGAGPITPPPATESPLIAVADGAAVTSTGGSVSLLAGPGGTVRLGAIRPSSSGSLVAGPGQLVTLQMDALSVTGPASSITAPGGTIEIAPATEGDAIDFATAASNTLTIPGSAITALSAGTLRLGAVTINGTETTTAGAIAFDASVDLTGHATTLQALATGPITESGGPLTVNTLTANGTAIDLPNANNAINTLGDVTSTSFTLYDKLALSLTGGVTATSSASITDTVSLTLTGNLGAPAVTLSAGSGGIALNGTSVLGQSGATVDLSSTGGVTQADTSSIDAATLQSSGGISGGAATLSGTANAIGTLAGFSVTSGALSLSDTGALTVTGPVTASAVTIGGVAGSTPTGIVATGDIGATGTLSLSAGSGGIILNGSADLTGSTVALNGGSGGITLEGASVLGAAGDVVDLTTTGGVDEMGTASIDAATLQSSGGVTGAVALSNANTVASVGQFIVSGTGAGFQLVDSGPLDVSGPLTAPGNISLSTNGTSSVTATGSIGAGPGATLSIASGNGGITLSGSAALTGGTITLNGGSGGIALEGASTLGATGEVVDLTTTGGGVTESGTATIVAATLQSSGGVVGAVALGDANTVANLGNFTVSGTGNDFTLADTGNLAVTGPLTAPGSITLSTSGAGSVTATGNIDAGAGATLSIASGSGGIALNGSAALTGGTIDLNGGTGGIALAGASVLGDAGAVVDLTTGAGGAVSESGTATIIAATLQSSGGVGGSVTLTDSNTVATLATFVVNGAGNAFQLDNDSNLLVSGTLNATYIALRAPFDVISLGNGASIITGGTPPASPGPLVAAQEPQFGAPGAYIEAASFNQIGSSFLSGQGGGEATLQVSITNTAQFDPPLGLQATNGWLILNLAEGTAAGSVYVKALNVTYDGSGSAGLFGSIDGITSRLAASIGFIQPSASQLYLFNDCEIGGSTCAGGTPPVLPPTFPTLPGLLPPIGVTTLNLLALPLLPTPACALPAPGATPPGGSDCALTDPDVVPPNVSYVDY